MGIIILLGAIVCLPVIVSTQFSVKEVPFQNRIIPKNAIRLVLSEGETKASMLRAVEGQLDALRSKDFGEAWNFASRGLRQNLPVADFERMVSTGFAIMTEDHHVEIGGAFNNREIGFIDVKLSSDSSGSASYSYILVAGEGRWFVSGVEAIDPRLFERRRPKNSGARGGSVQ